MDFLDFLDFKLLVNRIDQLWHPVIKFVFFINYIVHVENGLEYIRRFYEKSCIIYFKNENSVDFGSKEYFLFS